MEFGEAYLLAVSSGVLFGLHDVTARSTGLRESPQALMLASMVAGYPAILVAVILRGLGPMPPEALTYYSLAGLVNFNLGRKALYVSIRELGASGASVMTSLTLVIGMLFGAALGESITHMHLVGASLILTASLMVLGLKVSGRFIGVVAGIVMATCMALAIVFARLGNVAGGDPLFGVLVAYTVSITVEFAMARKVPILNKGVMLAGVFASLGQIARYIALSVLGASIVAPLHNIRPIVATIMTRSLARYTLERPGHREYAGTLLAFSGVVTMYLQG